MKRFLLPLTAILILAAVAATVAPNLPISSMPIANTLQTNAWIPIIQPLPGRTTNDNFRVAPSAFAAFLGTNNTSSTNIFNTIIVTNLYVENNLTVTNSFVTNINTTVINTNTTIINEGATIINTNVTQTFSFTTNIIDNSLTIYTNVLEITTNSITIYTNTYVTNATIFINGTNVAAINPTIGRLPYKSGTNTFDDSSMYFIDTNTTGTATLEVTDLANGGVVVSLLSGIVTNIVNGTGALTNDGAGNFGWTDLSGFANLWQVVGGTNLEPVNLALRPTTQLGWTIGTNTSAHWSGGMTNGEALISSRDVDAGERNNNEIFIETRGATNIASVDINTKTNISYLDQLVTIGAANYEISNVVTGPDMESQWIWGGYTVTDIHPTAPDGTTPYHLGTATNHTSGNLLEIANGIPPATTNFLSVDYRGGLIFGPGSTNVLYRSGTDLVYTNDSTDVKFEVKNNAGTILSVEAQSLTGVLSAGGSANAVGLRQGANQVLLANSGWYPVPDSSQSLGIQGNQWLDYNISGTGYTYGYLTNMTNYSRLAVHHSGTNGVGDGIVFDSQAVGAGGTPRPITYKFNGASTNSIGIGPSPAETPRGLAVDVNGEPVVTISAVGQLRVSTSGIRIPDSTAYYWSAGDVSTAALRNGMYNGTGTPEGSLAANVGSFYLDYTGGAAYVKTNGVGNTGWGKLKFE